MKLFIFPFLLVVSFIANAEVLYVGLNADMKGGAAKGGEAIRRGAEMAITDVNASGLLGARKLRLIVKDHRGNPARGSDNVQDFADDPKVVAILGGIHTPVVMHELPLIHKVKIPYLVPWAAGTPVIKNGFTPNYVFRLSVRDEYAGPVLIRHAKQTGIKSVALFLERTGWGRSNDRSMNAAAKESNVNVASTTWFNWGEKNFEVAIDEAVNAGAEAIMLVANAPEGRRITQAMAKRKKNQRIPIISHWGITGGDFSNDVGLDILKEVDLRVLQTYLFEDKDSNTKAQDLLARYQKQYPESEGQIDSVPGFVHSYDFIHLLALAIKQSDTLSRTDIRNNLEKLPKYKGLLRRYEPAFTSQRHEALDESDYSIARFNKDGEIVPWK